MTYSWACGAIVDTQISYRLEPDADGTHLAFEHSGFYFSQPWCRPAMKGLEFGYAKMFEKLPAMVAGLAAECN